MTEGKRQIIQQLLQEYDIETADDIQAALKGLLLHSYRTVLPVHEYHYQWIRLSD